MARSSTKKSTSSSAKKKTSSPARKTSSAVKKENRRTAAKKRSFLKSEIGAVMACAACVFLLLSDMGLMGGIGQAVRTCEKGLFGQGFFLPAVFIAILVFIFVIEKGRYLRRFKLSACVLMFFLMVALIELMFADRIASASVIPAAADLYAAGAGGSPGGGLTGGLIIGALRRVIGYSGAYFVIIVLMLISVIVLTEKSFVGAARAGVGRTAQAAKAGKEKYADYRTKKREKKANERLRAIDIEPRTGSQAGTDTAEDYLRYGREIIGEGQTTPADLTDLKAPLIRRSYKSSIDTDMTAFDTQVIEPVGETEQRSTMPVSIREIDYEADTVPFEEDHTERYRSYADILKTGAISAFDAGLAGFAAGSYGDIKFPGENVPEHVVSSFDAFRTEEKETTGEDEYAPHDTGEPEETTDEEFPYPEKEVNEGETEETSVDRTREPQSRKKKTRSGKAADTGSGEDTPKPYVFPVSGLLSRGSRGVSGGSDRILDNAKKLEKVFREFGVGVTVSNIIRGPRVSRYELIPDTGVKVSRITALEGDIKLALAASELRIEAPIPGKSAVGIEVPNEQSSMVRFRDIYESDEFRSSSSPLTWGIGLDIQGRPVVGDISKMPHLLVAGTTGSGKSVGINTLIMSILYKSTPEEVRMILIDPKVVELSVYEGIPHLLTEVVTKPERALSTLNWAVAEMNRRYRVFRESATRNISGYNEKVEKVKKQLPPDTPAENIPGKLPYILIIIDELSELMMHAKRDVEQAIVSLTQLARAAGIHLVVATQRPSVDVITGLIKSNIPSRVAYRLPSAVDSRTILDSSGAETLLGNGDMLYKPGDRHDPQRVQGAFLSDEEVEAVVRYVRKHNFGSDDQGSFDEAINAQMELDLAHMSQEQSGAVSGRDEYFADAARLIVSSGKASIGALQRKFKIGFNRAARIMDQLHDEGVVSASESTKERQVLMDMNALEELLRED